MTAEKLLYKRGGVSRLITARESFSQRNRTSHRTLALLTTVMPTATY